MGQNVPKMAILKWYFSLLSLHHFLCKEFSLHKNAKNFFFAKNLQSIMTTDKSQIFNLRWKCKFLYFPHFCFTYCLFDPPLKRLLSSRIYKISGMYQWFPQFTIWKLKRYVNNQFMIKNAILILKWHQRGPCVLSFF